MLMGKGPQKKTKVKIGAETAQPVHPEAAHPTTSKAASSQEPPAQTHPPEQPPSKITTVDQVFNELFGIETSLPAPIPGPTTQPVPTPAPTTTLPPAPTPAPATLIPVRAPAPTTTQIPAQPTTPDLTEPKRTLNGLKQLFKISENRFSHPIRAKTHENLVHLLTAATFLPKFYEIKGEANFDSKILKLAHGDVIDSNKTTRSMLWDATILSKILQDEDKVRLPGKLRHFALTD